ncbi:SMP-30/gluconolactonase/LRE family protein [Sporocytophaga myxococcoides]|uniref:NHL domain-containing protein n=1 Tax=Sporocytophaga myxococcoides TaxID=153721 RepID=UPI000401532B|nr:SMP-30/gluconolactonase/LRE family protein [Sporocytophaga myxococcoides]
MRHNSIFKLSIIVYILGFLSTSGYGQVVSTLAGLSLDADGPAAMSGFSSPNGVAIDSKGNVYVAEADNNKIRKISAQGIVSTFAGDGGWGKQDGEGKNARFMYPWGIAIDTEDNVYVSELGGHRVRKITPDGVVSTLAGNGDAGSLDGTGTEARFIAPSSLVVDGTGTVYVADTRNNKIRKITPEGVVSTLAGKNTSGFADGAGADAMFSNPSGIAIDANGNLFVADYYNDKIRKITPDGTVSTFAGSTDGRTNGDLSVAKFSNPYGIAIDAEGNMYIGEEGNNVIRKISKEGIVSTYAGTGGIGDKDGNATSANFYNPHGIAVDAAGNVYVADIRNHKIRKVTQQGIVSTIGGIGYARSVDGTVPNVRFKSPTGVTINEQGIIYIADEIKIRKLTPAGVATTLAGSDKYGSSDGTGAEATFNDIKGITIDAIGNLFVTDDHKIRKITPEGIVTTFAGSDTEGFVDGNGTDALFDNPFGLTIDAKGNLYVADQYNNSIRKITPNGDVSTFAGAKQGGYKDGKGLDARFSSPHGIGIDKNGNLYVADKSNHRIRKINPEGEVSTLAGSMFQESWDGTGASAAFSSAVGICVDSSDNVYVTQTGTANFKIRKVTPSGVVTTLAGKGIPGSLNGPAASVSFNNPVGITIDANYNLYVADQYNFQIRKISLPNDIKVLYADNEVESPVDFGTVKPGKTSPAFTFSIENGTAALKPLFLSGKPLITVSSNDFIIDLSNTSSSVGFGDSTEFSITFKPSTLGLKTATVTIPNNNLDGIDFTFEIKGFSAPFVDGISSSSSSLVSCYPNPASTRVIIESPVEMLLEVYSSDGNKLMEQMMERGENSVNIETLSRGLYLFKMPLIGKSIKVIKN